MWCGIESPTQLRSPCLSCIIELHGDPSPRWALAIRQIARPPFHPSKLLAFSKYDAHLLLNPFSINDLSIKVGEQARIEAQMVDTTEYKVPSAGVKNPGTSSSAMKRVKTQDDIDKLRAELCAENGDLCSICSQPLKFPAVDSVLPTALKHSDLEKSKKLNYYQCMRAAGLLAPTCPLCNVIKGVCETRGIKILRRLLAGEVTLFPVGFITPEQPLFLKFQGDEFSLFRLLNAEPNPKPVNLTDNDRETIAHVLLMFALRISCPEKLDEPKELIAYYCAKLRLLWFLAHDRPLPKFQSWGTDSFTKVGQLFWTLSDLNEAKRQKKLGITSGEKAPASSDGQNPEKD